MKPYNYRSANALTLIITCVFFLGRYAASQATGSEAQSGRVAIAPSASAQSVKDPARLIIRESRILVIM
jgi:hypothetical protein